MRADLDEKMVRHTDAMPFGECSRAEPSGHSPDFHDVRHDIVASPRTDRLAHIVCSPPVLAALNGSSSLARDPCVTGVIVGDRRLLDPRQSLVIEAPRAVDSL